jgi:tetratricopeptide (TPR) repeat protein
MGIWVVEFSEIDRFSLTSYASQPNDLSELTPEAHAALRRTVAALSGYPGSDEGLATHVRLRKLISENSEALDLRKWMLRAAYGIFRFIYSVSSLARLTIAHEHIERGGVSVDATQTGTGIFESHRQQIWWLLKQAGASPPVTYAAGNVPAAPTVEVRDDLLAPFYAEEVVWLYNECGVLSLVEGRLADASDLFELALRTVETSLEPHRGGPLSELIYLNLAIVDIDRGHIRRARDALKRILRLVQDEESTTHWIAKGYLARIRHLTGDAENAERDYAKVIEALIKQNETRAASIFARHRVDLVRVQTETRVPDAARELERAMQLARDGGHADVQQWIILSEARLLLSRTESFNSGDVHSRLDAVETYARMMGMDRLSCGIDYIRARLYKRNGDFRSASSYARSALEIASRHDLRLRKTSILPFYASIHYALRSVESCRPLMEQALFMAQDTGFFDPYSKVAEIQRDLRISQAVIGDR